ncbi:hypothetical protein [Paraburkholderia flagellata]|uniref:hypothetical protein n=1 Tax=Paraburkholderia flagellata TaxID=2883241 RepID=UPI001F408A26|nr:hypothetical protein [Paraburkholderia flagellata]
MLALGDGDPVAVCGSLSVGVWKPEQGEPRPQVSVTATGVLTPYHVAKRRTAAQQGRQPQPDRWANGGRRVVPTTGELEDDELDF